MGAFDHRWQAAARFFRHEPADPRCPIQRKRLREAAHEIAAHGGRPVPMALYSREVDDGEAKRAKDPLTEWTTHRTPEAALKAFLEVEARNHRCNGVAIIQRATEITVDDDGNRPDAVALLVDMLGAGSGGGAHTTPGGRHVRYTLPADEDDQQLALTYGCHKLGGEFEGIEIIGGEHLLVVPPSQLDENHAYRFVDCSGVSDLIDPPTADLSGVRRLLDMRVNAAANDRHDPEAECTDGGQDPKPAAHWMLDTSWMLTRTVSLLGIPIREVPVTWIAEHIPKSVDFGNQVVFWGSLYKLGGETDPEAAFAIAKRQEMLSQSGQSDADLAKMANRNATKYAAESKNLCSFSRYNQALERFARGLRRGMLIGLSKADCALLGLPRNWYKFFMAFMVAIGWAQVHSEGQSKVTSYRITKSFTRPRDYIYRIMKKSPKPKDRAGGPPAIDPSTPPTPTVLSPLCRRRVRVRGQTSPERPSAARGPPPIGGVQASGNGFGDDTDDGEGGRLVWSDDE